MDQNKSADKSVNESVDDDGSDQISSLINSVPALKDLFAIHCKVGEGTFSSVFLATLKNSSKDSKKFAVKHLVPTCHPGRIQRELQCLKEIGGQDHIVGLDLCLRHAGSVVFVMPYLLHDRFSDYVHDMSAEEIKDYMKALLTALQRVHKFNIIHRDIKPSNFLYNRQLRRYLLVDFGLAQQYKESQPKTEKEEKCKESQPKTEKEEKCKESQPKTEKEDVSKDSQSLKRKRIDENKIERPLKTANKPTANKCYCFGKPKVCSMCLIRPLEAAPRAGTPGYRAPEVLLKHLYQTPAIDIWASGVIMLSILTGTQPFFRSPDDMTALAEITAIFGTNAMQLCARKLGKKLMFSSDIKGMDLITICQKLQKRNNKASMNTSTESVNKEAGKKYPQEAYELLIRLLDIDYKTRITAEQALLHPFFKD